MVTMRAFKSASQRCAWDECKVLIMHDQEAKDPNPLGLHTLPQSGAEELQFTMISKGFADLAMRSDTDAAVQDKNIRDLLAFIGSMSKTTLLSDKLTKELQRVHKALSISHSDTHEVLNEAKICFDEITKDKQGLFYKSITLLPTTMDLTARCSKVLDQLLKDESLAIDLGSLLSQVAKIPAITSASFLHGGAFSLVHQDELQSVKQSYLVVVSTSSQRFREKKVNELEQIDKFFADYAKAAIDAVLQNLDTQLQQAERIIFIVR